MRPLSARAKRRHLAEYARRIQQEASKVIRIPLKTYRIDIEIFFISSVSLRADVDNVAKPILDALKGVAYHDDKQVRSLRVTAFPVDEAFGISGTVSRDFLDRVLDDQHPEILVQIFEDISWQGDI